MVTVKATDGQDLLLPLQILKKLRLQVGEKVQLHVTDSTIRFFKYNKKGSDADRHLRKILENGFNLSAMGKLDRENIYEDIA